MSSAPKQIPDELYVMTKVKKLLLLLTPSERARVVHWVSAAFIEELELPKSPPAS